MSERRPLASHALWPAVAFIAVAALFAFSDLDRMIAHGWAFDAGLHDFPARDSRWAKDIVHTGGRSLVLSLGLAAIAAWIASFCRAAWRDYRRPALFVFAAIALSALSIAILKELTNVDCPWDLDVFGGRFPYVHLFAARPDNLPHAACFPGAHSASGFALMALYFAFRERNHRLAIGALAFALVLGSAFGFAQEARGAHFLSHDLWSAFIVWYLELALYACVFRWRLWPPE
jgi:membrane-associated PAP2 superfamily phosphatase